MSRPHHLDSLDVFRGATVAAMIVVNNPGDWGAVFPQLLHADWNGCTVADVVFPFFVFIMGCAMPFAFARRNDRWSSWSGAIRIIERSGSLVALGLVLNLVIAVPHLGSMRVPGVLQRLGLTYLAAAFVVRSFGVWTQGLIAIVLLVGHWAVLTLIPYGGHAGPVTRMHNLAGAIDARVFGLHTLMPGFDPEGLLGTATSVGSALTGAIAGQWLRKESDQRRRVLGLAGAGAMAVLLGVSWSMVWPVNKPLWSGSYVLVTSGLAALTLALCVYVIDDGRCRRWAQPFIWLGVNPLVIYFCSELVGHLIERPLLPRLLGSLAPKDWLYWQILSPLSGNVPGEWSSLLFATAFAAMWMGASAALHWNDVRIRV